MPKMSKTSAGNFFEDFSIGQDLVHAVPRTVTAGDVSLYTALYGMRFPVQSSAEFARRVGYADAPLDDLLVFHIIFGKTVPEVSLNAVANLGYAGMRFAALVFPGDTLTAHSTVIGLKQNSNGKTGTVYVRSTGVNQAGQTVLDYVRWVMVKKRAQDGHAPDPVVPDLPETVAAEDLTVPETFHGDGWDFDLSGESHRWGDYEPGEKIDHVDGMTMEEAEHQIATRLYQNTSKVHFNQHQEKEGRFGRRIVYGGHVISLARALSFNGLANAFRVAAVNAGSHTSPAFAGDTVYAWSEVLERIELPGRDDLGALRLRTVATKDTPCSGFPLRAADGTYDKAVLLDLDYTVLIPR